MRRWGRRSWLGRLMRCGLLPRFELFLEGERGIQGKPGKRDLDLLLGAGRHCSRKEKGNKNENGTEMEGDYTQVSR